VQKLFVSFLGHSSEMLAGDPSLLGHSTSYRQSI